MSSANFLFLLTQHQPSKIGDPNQATGDDCTLKHLMESDKKLSTSS